MSIEAPVPGWAIPSWEDGPQFWNECYLGGHLLPGGATINGLDTGPKIDKQKRRKREGKKFRDNGLDPAKFSIDLVMTAEHWLEWNRVLPLIYSTSPNGERQPLQIGHPLPNHIGVHTVYILKIKPSDPTADGMFKVSIEVEQWFEELKETKAKTTASLQATFNKDALIAAGLIFANAALPPAGAVLTHLAYGKPKEEPANKSRKRGTQQVQTSGSR